MPKSWLAGLKNGDLLDAAEQAGFDFLLSCDKNIKYEQNLAGRTIAVVVLGQGRWRLLRRRITTISPAVNAAQPGSYSEVDIPVR